MSGTLDQYLGGASGLKNEQVFTSSGTFTVPSGVRVIYVSGAGGGAGGASGSLSSGFYGNTYSGQCGESCLLLPIRVVPNEAIAVTIGAGGVGPAAITGSTPQSSTLGTNGGSTTFRDLELQGGVATTSSVIETAHRQYGLGSIAPCSQRTSVSALFPANTSYNFSGSDVGGIAGGSSLFGRGGAGGLANATYNGTAQAGGDATGYGAGGGAGGTGVYDGGTATSGKGGNGSPGIIILNW